MDEGGEKKAWPLADATLTNAVRGFHICSQVLKIG